jgi:hypothetical protein
MATRQHQGSPRAGQSDQRPRCEDHTFIHSWLDQIRASKAEGPGEAGNQPDEGDHDTQPWRPHNLPICGNGTHRDPGNSRDKPRWTGRDSPLLTQPAYPTSDRRSRDTISYTADGNSRHSRRSDRSDAKSDERRHSPTSKNPFEKRPRRKTRADRYDMKRQRTKHEKQARRKSTSRQPKRSKDHRSLLRSGKEVMEKFTSAAIPVDRVTVSLALYLPYRDEQC